MPTVNDILRVALFFRGADGDAFMNVYTLILTLVASQEWEDVATDIEDWFRNLYSDWLTNVSQSVSSEGYEISRYDVGAGQFDQVYSSAFTDLQGDDPNDSLPSINAGSIIAYPAQPRHRGFKNLPPPVDTSVANGRLIPDALADLSLFGVRYVLPRTGNYCSWNNGVLSLATGTFRPFTDSVKVTDIIGSRVTRKTGRGI